MQRSLEGATAESHARIGLYPQTKTVVFGRTICKLRSNLPTKMSRVASRSCCQWWNDFPLLARTGNGRTHVQQNGHHQSWARLAAGTVTGLKQSEDETLEDVFIRLVGHSIEEVERHTEEGITSEEE